MVRRWVWALVGVCAACGGEAADRGGRVEPDGATSFPIPVEMVSRRGSDNVACFGADDPIARNLDEMAGHTCELARSLRLGDIRYSDADGDGKLEPGEALQLRVELSAAPEHPSYPGIFARVASERVAPSSNGNGLYALLAGSPVKQLTLDFQVSADAERGEELEFAVCATDTPGRRTACRQVDELDFELIVE